MKDEIKEDEKKPEKIGGETEVKRDEKGKFVEGTAPGPGRTLGKRDFLTDFMEAAEEIAEALQLGKEPDKVKVELLKRGIKEGLAGKFPFWKEIFDRIYGVPKQSIGIGPEEGISEVEIKIKPAKKDEGGITSNNSVPIELGGIPKEKKQNNNSGGRYRE